MSKLSKLNELFVESINMALMNAEVIADKYQKSMAYATTAQALAVYLNGSTEPVQGTAEFPAFNIPVAEPVKTENEISSEVEEEALRLSEKNKEVIKALDEAIKKTSEPVAEETQAPAWELPYDENGIPYLNSEDFSDPHKVMAYENAMTPEIMEKKRAIEVAQGEAVLNEMSDATSVTPTAPAIQSPVEFKQEDLDALEGYKVNFDYVNDPSQLDMLYHNFTDGVFSSLNDITPETIEAFLSFIKMELSKAYEEVEGWKNSWITKEGLDNLISGAYGVEGATIEQYLHDGNVFWFVEYIKLYNANAYFNSYVQGEIDKITLNNYVKQYFDDNTLTVDCITDENVVGFVYFVQESLSQTA